jgi:hypothetical protein
MNAQKGLDLSFYSFFNFDAIWGGCLRPGPSRFTARKEILHPFYRRLGGPQEQSGRVRKKLHPWRFDPRTIQVLASRYINLVLRLRIMEAKPPLHSMSSWHAYGKLIVVYFHFFSEFRPIKIENSLILFLSLSLFLETRICVLCLAFYINILTKLL